MDKSLQHWAVFAAGPQQESPTEQACVDVSSHRTGGMLSSLQQCGLEGTFEASEVALSYPGSWLGDKKRERNPILH